MDTWKPEVDNDSLCLGEPLQSVVIMNALLSGTAKGDIQTI